MKISGHHDKTPNYFRPSRLTILMGLAAFMLVTLLSMKAVNTADEAADKARSDLNEAKFEIQELQDQITCAIDVIVLANRGMLDNSIVQDDLLLASAEGGERQAVSVSLRETRQRLVEILNQMPEATGECPQ